MRQTIARLPGSKIREVANAGLGRTDVLPFWFGESDEVTPLAVRQAAADALARGETFYSHNLGLPELREALRVYVAGLHGDPGPDRIAVASSGVTALMTAMQLLVDAGDQVVVVAPIWPNLPSQALILGAQIHRVSLKPDGSGAWRLDMDQLLAAVTPATRVLLLNAPNNPTGWALTRAEQQALLDHCRQHGHLDRRRRGLRAAVVRRRTNWRANWLATRRARPAGRPCPGRAQLPGHRNAGRPAHRRPQLFSKSFPDDRLAPGLAGAAAVGLLP